MNALWNSGKAFVCHPPASASSKCGWNYRLLPSQITGSSVTFHFRTCTSFYFVPVCISVAAPISLPPFARPLHPSNRRFCFHVTYILIPSFVSPTVGVFLHTHTHRVKNLEFRLHIYKYTVSVFFLSLAYFG